MSGSVQPPAGPKPLRTGDRIARKYRLVRQIGTGGMGQVWIARNEANGADIALKVLRREGDRERIEEAVSRFRHEARLGAVLSHRSITRAYDLIEQKDGSLVLVMELLRGQTLQSYLRDKGELETKEAIAIILPVLSALQ